MTRIQPVGDENLTALNELYRELSGRSSDPVKMGEVFGFIRRDPRYHLLGAFGEEGLLGTVMGIVCYDLVKDCRPFMVVENVVVARSARGRGIGAQLMRELESRAEANGCAYLMLVSGAERKEAHAFYEALGYRQDRAEGFRKKLHGVAGLG